MAVSLRRHEHVGNAFVEDVYGYLSPVYDIAFGPILQPGRIKAMERLAIEPGHHVLEVGAGTGINAPLYPRDCHVTAIDLSSEMLDRARARVARLGLTNVRLLAADAARMTFADDSFDRVYAPYTISVVPDPVHVVREMCRVCRPGGRVVILNHFRSTNRAMAKLEEAISPATVHLGFKADLDLEMLMKETGLRPCSVEKVNFPPIWSLVTCVKRT
jgi:phosphatidylethanolamine/phosphatidyl-N-methylethanolamine N-methyltransferase